MAGPKPLFRFGSPGQIAANIKKLIHWRQTGYCARCGMPFICDDTTKHHKDPNRKGYIRAGNWNIRQTGDDPEKMEVLCYDCHDILEPHGRGVSPERREALIEERRKKREEQRKKNK